PLPEDPTVLAASRKRAVPETADVEAEDVQRVAVHRNAVVVQVSANDRAQPLADLGDWVVHAPLELGFHLAQLRLQSLADGLPQDREAPVAPLFHADVREAEEVERLRSSLAAFLPALGRERSEFQQARLLGVQFQVELSESLLQLPPEPLG